MRSNSRSAWPWRAGKTGAPPSVDERIVFDDYLTSFAIGERPNQPPTEASTDEEGSSPPCALVCVPLGDRATLMVEESAGLGAQPSVGGMATDLACASANNPYPERVVYTAPRPAPQPARMQVSLSTIQPHRATPLDTVTDSERFVVVVSGIGWVRLGNDVLTVRPGSAFVVPAGALWMATNVSPSEPLSLCTVYDRAIMEPGTVHLV